MNAQTQKPFGSLTEYIALPRVSGLSLSPDGTRLATTVSTLSEDGTRYLNAVWEVDPSGARPARRLTRSAKGESGPAFTAGGDLLFTSARPDPAVKPEEDAPAALWLLPAGGGEARVVASAPGGIGSVRPAQAAPTVLLTAEVLAGAKDLAEDRRLRGERKDKKVTAVLHTGYPVRYWDHDLGPGEPRLFATDLTALDPAAGAAHDHVAEPTLTLRDLTPAPGSALREGSSALAADGTFVVSTWTLPLALGAQRTVLVRIDAASGDRVVLLDDEAADLFSPVISPDGTRVAYSRETLSTPEQAPRITVHVLDLATGAAEQLAADWDRWASSVAWLPDGSGLVVTADDGGRGPVFVVDLAGGGVRRVTADDATYSDVRVAPDGGTVYALRTSYLAAPHPVRIDLATGEVTELPGPVTASPLPGTLTEVHATGADGTPVRGWLALPHGAGPADRAPLLLWIHGGPLSSWNAWSWRWNPWIMVAHGYAVLLPDPALSTGYGQDFVQRGWGAWGKAPFTDLMAITDAAVARDDIDATRTGAMGGSFGGYMANWVAGHTDRFRAVVTHASLWALDQFGPTTDAAFYWQREMSQQMAMDNSPHLAVGEIRTPMLVVHGDRDYRVPIGEGLRLWYELLSASGLPAGPDGASPHRFLYFPTENHWVLSPQHAAVWYQVVLAFLAEHVLGQQPPPLPETLGR